MRNTSSHAARPPLVPALRYRDVAAAADWLCKALDFAEHSVVCNEDGDILHAKLTFGDSMVLLLPVNGTSFDGLMRQPDEIGGAETQSCYLVVADLDLHYQQAITAGARIVRALDGDGEDDRSYSCRDPEGHIWSFGSHDPWREVGLPAPQRQTRLPDPGRRRRHTRALFFGAAGAVVMAGVAGWTLMALSQPGASATQAAVDRETIAARAKDDAERAMREAVAELAEARAARTGSEQAVRTANEQLAAAQTAKDAAEQAVRHLDTRLTWLLRAKQDAEQSASAARDDTAKARDDTVKARDETARERHARETAESAAKDARKEVVRERDARRAAERSAQDALAALRVERAAREAAEAAAKQAQDRLSALQSPPPAQPQKAAHEPRKSLARPVGPPPLAGQPIPPIVP